MKSAKPPEMTNRAQNHEADRTQYHAANPRSPVAIDTVPPVHTATQTNTTVDEIEIDTAAPVEKRNTTSSSNSSNSQR